MNELQYPVIEFIEFKQYTDYRAFIGHLRWNINAEEFTIPLVFSQDDLNQNTKQQLVTLFSRLFENALYSAHDCIDSRLQRGAYLDQELRMDTGL